MRLSRVPRIKATSTVRLACLNDRRWVSAISMGAGISLGEVLPPSIAHPDRLSGFLGATDDRSVTSVRSEENRVDSRLSDFLARAESVLARLEPLLPAVREAVDWERSLAARWHRDGRS
ncbi:hypothetical protein ALP65_04010, partial [Pseudomonas aeruginosa]